MSTDFSDSFISIVAMDILVRTKRREGGKGSVKGAPTQVFLRETLKSSLEISLYHDLLTLLHPRFQHLPPSLTTAMQHTLGRKNIEVVGFLLNK